MLGLDELQTGPFENYDVRKTVSDFDSVPTLYVKAILSPHNNQA